MPRLLDLDRLGARLREFAQARDWDQFHTPKNLAAALVVEAGELLENFQWLTDQQSAEIFSDPIASDRIRREIADVMIYLVRLSDVLNIDIEPAIYEKIAINEDKYPVSKSRGSARKYTDL